MSHTEANTYRPPLVEVENIARVAHEANRAYCRAIGDDSQPSWEDAPAWQRESAMNGVRFHQDNPGSSPAQSHENWLAQKIAEGWRYGPAKNPETKEHPCCVPYDQLPVEQRAKDYIFSAIVEAMSPRPAARHLKEHGCGE